MKKYLPLAEAAKNCNYSQEYLSLRARQGKLKAIKVGRNWFTTTEWLQQYVDNINRYIIHNFSTLYQENIIRKVPRITWWNKIWNKA